MKQKLLIASAIFAIFSLASCKKDDPAPGGNNPGTEKKLKKITKTEAGLGFSNCLQILTCFYYDVQFFS